MDHLRKLWKKTFAFLSLFVGSPRAVVWWIITGRRIDVSLVGVAPSLPRASLVSAAVTLRSRDAVHTTYMEQLWSGQYLGEVVFVLLDIALTARYTYNFPRSPVFVHWGKAVEGYMMSK